MILKSKNIEMSYRDNVNASKCNRFIILDLEGYFYNLTVGQKLYSAGCGQVSGNGEVIKITEESIFLKNVVDKITEIPLKDQEGNEIVIVPCEPLADKMTLQEAIQKRNERIWYGYPENYKRGWFASNMINFLKIGQISLSQLAKN